MNKNILNYINQCEEWKLEIKELHWASKNLSQHKLCDDIAGAISDFEDLVSEVEQSISGKIKLNTVKPGKAHETTLKAFVEDVISKSQSFLKTLSKMGDEYIGIKSECESFIGVMQRNLYLVNFTMKEEMKRRLAARLNESYKREENIKTKYHGFSPKTEGGMFKRINDITKEGQLNTRKFDDIDDALEFYKKIFFNAGIGDLYSDSGADENMIVKLDASNGITYTGLMKSKETEDGRYKSSIVFSPHGDETQEDEMDDYELYSEGKVTRMTGNEFMHLIEQTVKAIVKI